MRYAISMTLLLLLAMVTSCEKKCNDPVNNGATLLGTWELRSEGGGFSGQTTNYLPGNGNIYVFTANTYKRFEQGNLIKSGTYYLTEDTSMLSGEVEDMIIFDNDVQMHTMIEVKNNQLNLEMDANDGGGSTWARQ